MEREIWYDVSLWYRVVRAEHCKRLVRLGVPLRYTNGMEPYIATRVRL